MIWYWKALGACIWVVVMVFLEGGVIMYGSWVAGVGLFLWCVISFGYILRHVLAD